MSFMKPARGQAIAAASRAALFVILMAPAASGAQAPQWSPEKNVEIIVGVNPGGSIDRTGRDVQRILQMKKLVNANSTVVNKPGGGHSVALNYLNQHPGDAHYLQVIHFLLFTNYITGKSSISYANLTPIALLFNEYFGFAVRADSPIRTGKDFIERLRKDPGSVSISVSTGLGTVNHILAARVVQAAGIDAKRLRTVVFNSAAEGITALAGGHIDVSVTTLFSIQPMVEKGMLRFFAVATPQRVGGALAQVPTWREQGIDVEMGTWRSVIAPGGLAAPQIAFWDDVFSKMTKQDEWRAALEKNYLTDNYLPSAQTRKFFDAEYGKYKSILADLGMAKQEK